MLCKNVFFCATCEHIGADHSNYVDHVSVQEGELASGKANGQHTGN